MKMNKKIVIALAVLAAFMMLVVPVAILTQSEDISADAGETGPLNFKGVFTNDPLQTPATNSDTATNAGLGNQISVAYNATTKTYTVTGTLNKQTVGYEGSAWTGNPNSSQKVFYSWYHDYNVGGDSVARPWGLIFTCNDDFKFKSNSGDMIDVDGPLMVYLNATNKALFSGIRIVTIGDDSYSIDLTGLTLSSTSLDTANGYVLVKDSAGVQIVENENELRAAVVAGGSIRVDANITVSSEITLNDKTVTLDLNNHSITTSAIDPIIKIEKGSLTIDGTGTMTNTKSGADVILIIAKDNTSNAADWSSVYVGEHVTLAGEYAAISSYGTYYGGINITVAGTLTAKGNTIYINGNFNNTINPPQVKILSTAHITAANGTDSVGVYAAGYANWSFAEGCTVSGLSSAMELRAGTMIINGGTFTASATPTSVNPDGSGTTTKGAAVAIVQHTTKLDIDVTINGGTFEAYTPFIVKDIEENKTTNVSVKLNGGSYNVTNSGTIAIQLDDWETTVGSGKSISLAKELYVGTYGKLTNNGTMNVNGTSTIKGVLTNNGTINNSGTITSTGNVTNAGTLTNNGLIKFNGGTIVNNGTINNTGEVAFLIGIATADPGTNGLITSGANGYVSWYETTIAGESEYYIGSGESGSFKMTGIYNNNVLVGIKTEFTAGSAIITTVGNNANDVWIIASGVTVTVPKGITLAGAVTNNGTIAVTKKLTTLATLTVTGTLTNAGVIDVEGTLADSYTATQVAQMIVNTNGTINVAETGTLKVGYFTGKGVNIDGKINFATGGKFLNNAGTENTLIAGTGSALILMTAGTVTIDAKAVGGAVTYTLQKDAKAQFVQVNLTGFAFKAGDVIDIDGELTIATSITIPEGAKLNVNGKVTGGATSVITLVKSASLDIGSAGAVSVDKIDMTDSNAGVKAVMIKAGGVITALVDGSTKDAPSKADLKNITAGNGGLSIIKGSVYINGTLATPDNTGKITVPAGAVKISGNVEEGVTLEVPAGSSVVIPKDSTLTFEEGSKFNYDNGATITFEEKSSSIIYEKGSEVNDVVIEVETKEDSEGTTVAVHIYLVSENEKKLIISVDYVEVLPGKTYGDALNGVIVMPTKKSVTFEGWYNLAFNEKIRSTDIVGNNDVTLTACFSDEGRVPVQKEDTPSETIIIDGTTDSQSFAGCDFALPVAIICLIVAILALGFVVLKKR